MPSEPEIAGHLPSPDRDKDALLTTEGRVRARLARSEAESYEQVPKSPPDIPSYRFNRFIASGGQGAVWLATRIVDKSRVAIKVMHRQWMDDTKARARFEQSYEALLAIVHPGIARALDRGVVPTGELWYATHYVSGANLDRYVESLSAPLLVGQDTRQTRDFPLRAVLQLFVGLCEAIEAAHRVGIIHRDLKPSNIVVDSTGRPHIVDFGIAKTPKYALDDTVTNTGDIVGSPFWCSPEQVDRSFGLIDTRTDIYSIGVMLYSLIVERFPYDVDVPLPRVFDQIRYVEPPRPTSLVSWVDNDLQSIMFKALRKSPSDRYQTVGELRLDIEKYLRGEAVSARGDGFWYRTRKALLRHKLAFGAASALAILTIMYAVSATIMYRGSERSSADAKSKYRIARSMANLIVSQINDELTNLPGSTAARRRLLDVAATHLDQFNEEHGDDPELIKELAQAHFELADIAGSLADDAAAKHHADIALTLRKRIVDLRPSNPSAKADLSIAWVRVGDFCKGLGDFSRCRFAYEEAMSIDEGLVREHPGVPTYADNLAWSFERNGALAFDLGDCARYLELSDRRLALAEQLARNEPNVTIRQYGLAAALLERNAAEDRCLHPEERGDADARLERALEITQRIVAAEPTRLHYLSALMFRWGDVAGLAARRGDLTLARERFELARATARKLIALEPNQPVWRCNLAGFDVGEGRALKVAGNIKDAEVLFRRAYDETFKLAEETEFWLARESVVGNADELADILRATGRGQEAHDIKARVFRLWRGFRDMPDGSPAMLINFAECLLTCEFHDLRDPAAALGYAERAADLSRHRSARILVILAQAQLATGDPKACEQSLAAARSVWQRSDDRYGDLANDLEKSCRTAVTSRPAS